MNSLIHNYWSMFIMGLATSTMVKFTPNLVKHIVTWMHIRVVIIILFQIRTNFVISRVRVFCA